MTTKAIDRTRFPGPEVVWFRDSLEGVEGGSVASPAPSVTRSPRTSPDHRQQGAGELVPNEGLYRLTIRLSKALVRAAKLRAAETDRDLQEVVRDAIIFYLEKSPRGRA
jgi:hypothetical protein